MGESKKNIFKIRSTNENPNYEKVKSINFFITHVFARKLLSLLIKLLSFEILCDINQ